MTEKSSIDKLIGTIRFVLIFGALGAGCYFLWPLIKKEAGEVSKAQDDDAELAAIPREINTLDLKLDPGLFNHDLLFTNNSDYILTNVIITVKLIKSDKTTTDVKGYWDRWKPGEIHKVTVSAEGARIDPFGVVIAGKGTVTSKNGKTKEVVVSGAWTMK